MTLRLGFVGCGKWGRKLAKSFRACGAEVVAYDRNRPVVTIGDAVHVYCSVCCSSADHRRTYAGPRGDGLYMYDCTCGRKWCEAEAPVAVGYAVPPTDGFGIYKPWRDQLADKSIDAIVAVAPPEITTEVALECARQGKAVMATKPLFDHPETIRAPFYVDFFRLWSSAHEDGRRQYESESPPGALSFELCGSGPFRTFPGLIDYGSHAAAAILDIDPSVTLHGPPDGAPHSVPCSQGEIYTAYFHNKERSRGMYLRAGNGSGFVLPAKDGGMYCGSKPRRLIWGHEETPTHIGAEPKDEVIQKMCRAFMADVSEGFVDTRLLNLGREGMRLLRQIRASAC